MTEAIPGDDAPPQRCVRAADDRLGAIGFVVVDRPVQGRAAGGVRFAADVSIDELAALARSMTFKWAFLNTAMGGAKAGIFASPQALGCTRVELMEAFGRAIAPLVQSGAYTPGVDLGTTLDDLRAIMRGAGRPLPERQIDGSLCTSLSTFEAIRQVVGVHGAALPGLRVALEGLGKVGGDLAARLAASGARLVAVSSAAGTLVAEDGLDTDRLLALRARHGEDFVHHYEDAVVQAPSELFAVPVDLLVPGARPHVVHRGNVDAVRARFVVPVANVPLTPEAEARLLARGTVVVPDFAANCGGILASAMLGHGFDLDDVRSLIERRLGPVMRDLFASARAEGRPLGEVVRAAAWRNHLAFGRSGARGPALERAARLMARRDWGGAWRRAAWRVHQRWPRAGGPVRRAAIDRYAEMTIAQTGAVA